MPLGIALLVHSWQNQIWPERFAKFGSAIAKQEKQKKKKSVQERRATCLTLLVRHVHIGIEAEVVHFPHHSLSDVKNVIMVFTYSVGSFWLSYSCFKYQF